MTLPPCKGCTDRKIGCHGVCKDYYEYTVKHKQEKEQARKEMPPLISRGAFLGSRGPKPGQLSKTRRT